ncbi:hypothetical protein LguiB_010457 [Lonicera macranthoides]
MGKGKLILICQSGGEFVTSDDGTLSYSGGEANAVNVNCETLFDDLKLKLAEMCNVEYKTIAMKYFLPGNRRNLITLKNAKDLKRMFDFHGNSVTVDIFVMGKEGFDCSALDIIANRATGVKPAETVNHVVLPITAPNSPPVNKKGLTTCKTILPADTTPPTTAGRKVAADASAEDHSRATSDSPPSSDQAADYDSDYVPRTIGAVPTPHSPANVDMTATPADTVKKRRRTASWKIGANGPTIVAVTDDPGPRKSRRKNARRQISVTVADETEQKQEILPKKDDIECPLPISKGIEDSKEYEEAYKELHLFPKKLLEANPGSFADFRKNDEKRFRSLFVSFSASISGFKNGCRPVLFLESTSLKSKYREILLTATALDGNDGFFPVAFAIVDEDDNDNWHWFLEQLKSAISSSQTLTLVSDREKNLKQTILEVFESAHYGYSIYHLMESFKKSLKGPYHGDGKGALPGNFLSAAHSVRLSGFKHYTQQIKQISPQAYDWVMQVEPEYWSSISFKGERYNHITQNAGDSYETLMLKSCELPITHKIQALISTMNDTMNKCRTNVSKWSTKLTPLKEIQLQDESLKANGLKVLFSSDVLFEVRDDSSHVVNIVNWDCSCLGWKQTGLPCRHAIAVFNSTGRSAYDYCSKYFTVDSFRLTYTESINPIPEIKIDKAVERENAVEGEDADSTELVLPPLSTRPPSPERKERNETEGGAYKRTVTCTRCKEAGHNKASCRAPVQV